MVNPALSRTPWQTEDDDAAIPGPGSVRPKVGTRFGGIDPVARAEQALKSLASQFGQWLRDEIGKLEMARAAIDTKGLNEQTGAQLYLHAHDLKGLGATYEFPIITRLAGTLCKVLEDPARRLHAPMALVDAHIEAIRTAVRDDIRNVSHPVGRAMVEDFEERVRAYLEREKGSSTAP